jgi:plasmid stabilization system protein ParE
VTVIQVNFSESAQDRHENWALGIAIVFGFSAAQSYIREIEEARLRIASFPAIGTDFTSPDRPNLKRSVTPSGYSIFYELDSPNAPTKATIISIVRGQKTQP